MAGNNIKGITVEINGETGPLDKALKGVNKTSTDLQAQLKQVNYQLKFDPGNTVLLQQKQELLAKSVSGTSEKLKSLKTAESQAQAQFAKGDISEKQYQSLQREVIKTESQLKNLEAQAKKSNVAVAKISEASDKISKGAAKVGQTTAPATIAVVALGGAAVKAGSDYIESLNKVDVAFGDSAKGVENFTKTTLDSFGIAAGTALDMASNYGDMATSMGLPQAAAAAMSEKLVGLGGDLASFKNISIDEANTALSSVFTGETESLKKLGIVMTQQNLQEFAASKGIKTKIADMTQQEQVQLRYNYVMDKTKSAQGDFARTSDGAANSMRVASESAKEASASIGIILAPVVAKIAQYVANLAKEFTGLSEGAKKTILVVLAIIAVVSPLAFIISGIATAVSILVGVIGFIGAPVAIVIAVIAALVVGFMLLWTHCEGFKAFWVGLWTEIKNITVVAKDTLVTLFTVAIPHAWDLLKTFFTGIPAWFSGLWSKTVANTVVILNPFITTIKTIFNSMKTGLTTIFNGLKLYFTGFWNLIKLIFLGPILLICDLVTGNFGKLRTDAVAIFNKLKIAFGQIWSGIKGIFSGAVQAIGGVLKLGWNTIVNVAKNIFNGLVSWLSALPGKLRDIGSNMFTSMRNGISGTIGGIGSTIRNGFSSGIAYIKSLPSQAFSWGSDMIQGIVRGIKSAAGAVGAAVRGVAQDIRSFLHFSVPDQGPLTDFETYMPDFMDGLAKGIKNSKHLVTDAIKGLSTDMSVGMQLTPAMAGMKNTSSQATSGNMTNNSYGSVLHTDNITIKNGMDIKAIAQELAFYVKQQNLGGSNK